MIEEKELFEGVTDYVICSTLNQVVNYIPLMMLLKYNEDKVPKIYNLTVKLSSEEEALYMRFDNQKWDNNFRKKVEEVKEKKGIKELEIEDQAIVYTRPSIRDTCLGKKILKGINQLSETENVNNEITGPVIWNITGGQRTLVFAIFDFILEHNLTNHYVIYLEGNSNQLYCGRVNQDGRLKFELMRNRYELKDLEIKTMLNLAGYDSNDNKNYLKQEEDKVQKYEEQFYTHLFDLYVSSLKKNDGRVAEILWGLNKNEVKLKERIKKVVKELKRYDETLSFQWDKNAEELLNKLKGKSQYKFGYALEKILLYGIKKEIKNSSELRDYFTALYHSVKIDKLDYSHTNESIKWHKDAKQLCEFDVVLLSKTGQLVVFECKTGDMISDVGKARVYTAYATNGVYAKPILITPLGEKEVSKLRRENAKDDDDEVIEEASNIADNHSSVVKAYRAALRSNLEVWGLDELETRLRSLFADAIGGGSVGHNK